MSLAQNLFVAVENVELRKVERKEKINIMSRKNLQYFSEIMSQQQMYSG